MTAEQHTEILTELRAIRAALEKRPAPPAASSAGATTPRRDGPVPEPTALIDLPGAVEVHFGKRKGTRLEDLPTNSLRWYAADWILREKDGGGLWPNDLKLLNAARQLWHARKNGNPAPAPAKAPEAPLQSAPANDEDVPF